MLHMIWLCLHTSNIFAFSKDLTWNHIEYINLIWDSWWIIHIMNHMIAPYETQMGYKTKKNYIFVENEIICHSVYFGRNLWMEDWNTPGIHNLSKISLECQTNLRCFQFRLASKHATLRCKKNAFQQRYNLSKCFLISFISAMDSSWSVAKAKRVWERSEKNFWPLGS